MTLTLIADRLIKGKLYPSLARHQAEPYTPGWREFEHHWPCTVPLRLQEYFEYSNIKINTLGLTDNWPADAFYPIGLGFFNFDLDYFELLPERVFTELWHSHIRILFYYHEGDNPKLIQQRLAKLVEKHQLPRHCYVFISGNTAARDIPDFVYFADFELWYYQRNLHTPPLPVHTQTRSRDFTALVRLHRPWRAMAMADLHYHHVLENSYWSYCEAVNPDTDLNECPIEVDSIDDLRKQTTEFLAHTPYISDELSNQDRNNHSITEAKYHIDSYCNLVFETHFDADQSAGAFLTEKTFKPIKHGQMFFIVGCAGSLQVLRDLGYRVFDGILDNSYDLEHNHTQRWIRLRTAIQTARQNLPQLFDQAQADIHHNQRLFVASKANRLNTLLEEIYEQRY